MIERFKSLFSRLGIERATTAFEILEKLYAEQHRAYHNLEHIQACLNELDQIGNLTKYPDFVELALWYHDAKYDTKSSNNERESAKLATEVMKRSKLFLRDKKIVRSLILATNPAKEPKSLDEQFEVDIDRSILGKSAPIFDQYDRKIRQEYSWVPDEKYRKGRKRILQSFLEKPFIYYTEHFRRKYEETARINLILAIKALN